MNKNKAKFTTLFEKGYLWHVILTAYLITFFFLTQQKKRSSTAIFSYTDNTVINKLIKCFKEKRLSKNVFYTLK